MSDKFCTFVNSFRTTSYESYVTPDYIADEENNNSIADYIGNGIKSYYGAAEKRSIFGLRH